MKKSLDYDSLKNFFLISNFSSLIFILLPPLVLFFLVLIYGVDVIVGDEWAIVPYIDKFLSKHLSFKELFDFHNEHRIPLPRVIMLINALLFNYNSKYQMFLGYFFIVGTFVVISMAIKKMFKDRFALSYLVFPSFLIFNMRQWENLLYGWQFQIPMMVFFTTLSFYFLSNFQNNISFSLSILFAVLASFSFGNGILIWVVGLIFLFLKRDYKKFLIWMFITMFFLYLYFMKGLSFRIQRTEQYASSLVSFLLYFFTSLANPLTTEKYSAFVLGFIVILFYLYILKNHRDYSFWLLMILFSLVSSFLITLSRSGFGWQSAIASRYASIYILGPVSVYCIFIYEFFLKKNRSVLKLFLLLLSTIIFQIISSSANYFKYEVVYLKNQMERFYILNYRVIDENFIYSQIRDEIDYLSKINPDLYQKINSGIKESVALRKEYSQILKRYNLSVFKDKKAYE